MIKISEEFKKYNYTFSRSLSTDIVLPYQLSDLLIGVNELANGKNFNGVLDKLQSNLMYLYSVSKYANPDLPRKYVGWVGRSKNSDGVKMDVKIEGKIFKSGLQFDPINNIITNSIPYFYFTDYTNDTYSVIFTYEGNVNPKTLNLPFSKKSFFIDITNIGDIQSINSVIYSLSGIDTITVQGGNNYLTIKSNKNGGVFFGNKDPLTYMHILGDNPEVTVTQGLEEEGFKLQNTDYNKNLSNDSYSNFDNVNAMTLTNATLSGFNNVFICSDTKISNLSGNLLSYDTSDYKITSSISTYGQNNQLNFLKINSCVAKDDKLFVCDTERNNIVSFNISGFVNDDNHRYLKFFENKIIGSNGGIRDNYQFNNPSIIDFYSNELHILDYGNQSIKVYNEDLGHLRTVRKLRTFEQYLPSVIKIYNSNYYWLTRDGKLLILDFDLNIKSINDLKIRFIDEYIDLTITNKNIYILTKNNVYKFFTSNLQYVGSFKFPYKVKSQLKLINAISNGEYDNLYVYYKNPRGALLSFEENEYYFNLLSDYEFEIFSKQELFLKKEEFNSSFAYNKSINKILKNILQLRNFIYRKVNTKISETGEYIFDGVKYFNPEDLLITNYETNFNNYIGVNEIFSSSVLNRVITETFNLCQDISKLLQSNTYFNEFKVSFLASSKIAIMQETYPDIENSFFIVEKSISNNDYILQEFAPIQETLN